MLELSEHTRNDPKVKATTLNYKFVNSILHENRYFLKEEIKNEISNLIEKVLPYVKKEIPSETNLYRCRINPISLEENQTIQPDYMLAPPPEISFNGRMNPVGISYLYTSLSKETSIAEMRPWIGLCLSLAELKTKEKLLIFNFCENKTEAKSYEGQFFNQLAKNMSFPLTKGDNVSYFATQYIAELIKTLNFDGIIYPSAMHLDGENLLIFDQKKVKVLNNVEYIRIKSAIFVY